MVDAPQVRYVALDWLRYFAVLMVCLNHASTTLLRLPIPLFGPAVYVEPARAGIAFLFLSSGFMLHLRYAETLVWGQAGVGGLARFAARRVWILLPPVVLLLAIDLAAGPNNPDTYRGPAAVALPAFLSLTQTWTYHWLGNASAVFPFDSSNLAWLASDLFFLSLVYLALRPIVGGFGARSAWGAVAAVLAVHAALLVWFRDHASDVARFGADHFGPRASAAQSPADFTFAWWLTFYSPYVRLFEFVAGMCVAQACRRKVGRPELRRVAAVLAGSAIALVGVVALWASAALTTRSYDLLCLGLLLAGWGVGARAARPGLWATLPLSAYILWLWHLPWFNAYRLPDLATVTARDVWFIGARFAIMVSFVILTSHGLWWLQRRSEPDWLRPLGRNGDVP